MERRAVRISIFGGVGASVDGRTLEIGGLKQHRTLAALLVNRNCRATTSQLIDRIWFDTQLPNDELGALRTYISRLRRDLTQSAGPSGDQILRTVDDGYELDREFFVLDRHAFEVAADLAISAQPEPATQLAAADEALQIWTGSPFGSLGDEPWLQAEVERLLGLHVAVQLGRVEALIDLRRETDAIAELELLVDEHPLNERIRELRMVALHHSGRTVDALRSYQDFRELLSDELGVEPGATLQNLENQLLVNADPTPRDNSQLQRARGYELQDTIGEGSFSIVFRALQPALNREVAIKQIRPELANDPHFIRRFEAEAHLVASLEHPHIVPLFDFWREPDAAFLVMRIFGGGTLADLLETDSLGVAEVERMVRQLGGALAFAHERGVVHRDIKAQNIFVDDRGNFFLGDFGIARRTIALASIGVGSDTQALESAEADVHALARVVQDALAPTQESVPVGAEVRQSEGTSPFTTLDRLIEHPGAYRNITDLLSDLATAPTGEDSFADEPPRNGDSGTTLLENPYMGLRAFQESDATAFFGRRDLVERLLRGLDSGGNDGRLATIVGPSGSGKSSLVRAGLLPALREGRVSGSADWFITTMTPGALPMAELDAALTRVATRNEPDRLDLLRNDTRGLARAAREIARKPDAELVVLIDQFEELFTSVADESVRRHFITNLYHAITDPQSKVRVVLTIRADFWDRPLQYGEFSQLVEKTALHITPLSTEQLENAISQPAQRVGAEFEPGLVTQIITDVRNQPGGLPLLQHTLRELCDRSHSGLMTIATYRSLGGVEGALARKAESTFEEVAGRNSTPPHAVRNLFTRLVTLGEGSEDTRRRMPASEMQGTDIRGVLDAFGEARLLTFDHHPTTREPTIELAHEALLREWPRLRGWIDDDRDDLRLHRHITEAANHWENGDRDPSELYRGGRLDAALDFANRRPSRLSEAEQRFLHAARQQRQAEDELRSRQIRRLRGALVTAMTLLVVAIAAGALALVLRGRAEVESARAESAREASETSRVSAMAAQTVASDKRMALLQAAEVYRRDPSPETLGALQRVLTKTDSFLGALNPGTEYQSVVFSSDDQLVIGSTDNGLDAFDVDTGQLVWTRTGDRAGLIDAQAGLVASPLASGGIELVHEETGDLAYRFSTVTAAAVARFSTDGTELYVGDRAGNLLLLDARTGEVIAETPAHPENSQDDLPIELRLTEADRHEPRDLPVGVNEIVINEQRGVVLTTGGFFVRAWDATTLEPLASTTVTTNPIVLADDEATDSTRRVPARPSGVVWLDDHALVATRSQVILVDPLDGELLGAFDPSQGRETIMMRGGLSIDSLGVSESILVADSVGDVNILNLSNGTFTPAFDLESPDLGRADRLAVDTTSSTVAVATGRGIRLHSLRGKGLIFESEEVTVDTSVTGALIRIGVSSDGRYLLQDDRARQPLILDRSEREFIDTASIGRTMFTYLDFHAPLSFVDTEVDALHLRSSVRDQQDSVTIDLTTNSQGTAATSDDGRYTAVGSFATETQEVAVFDRQTGDLVTELDAIDSPDASQVFNVAWSPDGRVLVAANDAGKVVAWTTSDWEPITPSISEGGLAVNSVIFTPDGEHLLSTFVDGTLIVRDSQSFQPTGVSLEVARGSGLGINGLQSSFSDDGRYLLTAHDEPTIVDTETWRVVGDPFPHESSISLHATPGGRYVATVVGDQIRIWNIDVSSWFEIACRAAGANFTESEWEQFGPRDTERSKTCPQWP